MAIEVVEIPIVDIPEGRALRVKVANRAILAVREGETFAVFLDRCPHKGMSMRHGTVLEGRLVCPYHQYPFALADGTTTMRRCPPATQFPFEMRGEELVVTVDFDVIDRVYQEPLDY